MKRLFTFAVLILTLLPLNALETKDFLQDKKLSKQVNSILQEISKEKLPPYNVVGLLYVGPATLKNGSKTLSSDVFTLIQEKGYITFKLATNKSFDSFSIQVISQNEGNPDPHRVESYYLVVKLFKQNKQVKEIGIDAIELNNAGICDQSSFYTNLAINAEYTKGKFYIPEEEPATCQKRVLIGSEKAPKAHVYETQTFVDHTADCKDHNHCSCPTRTVSKRVDTPPQLQEFKITTDMCKENHSCICPVYIIYK